MFCSLHIEGKKWLWLEILQRQPDLPCRIPGIGFRSGFLSGEQCRSLQHIGHRFTISVAYFNAKKMVNNRFLSSMFIFERIKSKVLNYL